jgi:hypothetical protein
MWFVCAAALVLLRLEFRASYFPPYFYGEEAQILDTAAAIRESRNRGFSILHILEENAVEYNKGYSWIALPFFDRYGYDVRIIASIVPCMAAIACGGFLLLLRRNYPSKHLIVSSIVAISLALFTLSVRRYKWHTVSYFTVLAVFCVLMPYYTRDLSERGKRWALGSGAVLLLASIFFYFGDVIYLVPLLFVLLVFEGKRIKGHWKAALSTFTASVVATISVYAFSGVWRYRVNVSCGEILKLVQPQILAERWDTIKDFATGYLTLPVLLVFMGSLAILAAKAKRGDRFCFINLAVLVWTMVLQFLIEGLNNPDWLNWSMLPLWATLVIGGTSILEWCEERGRLLGFTVSGAFVVIAAGELAHYPWLNSHARHQDYAVPSNTTSQAALVLRTISNDRAPEHIYYLPSIKWKEAEGGFDYGVNLLRVDYQRVLHKVRLVDNLAALEKAIREQPLGSVAIFWLGSPVGLADVGESPVIFGELPTVVYPFSEIYQVRYPVRKYTIIAHH